MQILLLLLRERSTHAIKITLEYNYTTPSIPIMNTRMIRVDQAHVSEPHMRDMMLLY